MAEPRPLPSTEHRNPASHRIDDLTSLQIVQLMNDEDATIAAAVRTQAVSIAQAIDRIAERIGQGGRLIYLGAGTSGRLGVLDASECPPTFSTPPDMVVGLIAGGPPALTRAMEGAEDKPHSAVHQLQDIGLTNKDVVVGIASSGRTPYVIGGLRYARQTGAYAIGFACTDGALLSEVSDLMIAPITGPEVITGSTRLKAGTATKMVLNMLTTGTMVRLGKTFGNLMVDLTATNEKLKDRSQRIVSELTGLSAIDAADVLQACNGEVKTSIVAQRLSVSPEEARQRLQRSSGHLRKAIEG